MRPRLIPALAMLLGTTGLPGCGDDGRVPVYPASGRVIVDGQPASGVELRFYPADRPGDLDALRPYATTVEDGTFRVGTYEDADGAPVGDYTLTLFLPDAPPGPSPPNDLLGGRYANPQRSDLEVTIVEGTNDLGTIVAEPAPSPPPGRGFPEISGDDPDGFGHAPGQ